jgi:hypothetical protein
LHVPRLSDDDDGSCRSPPPPPPPPPLPAYDVAQLQAGPEGVDANKFDFLAKGVIPCVFFSALFWASVRPEYYGWVPVHGSGTRESIESDDAIARACVEEAAMDAPGERYADHDSPEWRAFYEANKLDCELYEIARSTWRAQIQTGGLPPWRVAEMPDAVGGNSSCDRLDCART